jgi:hypothetical protein
MPKEITLKRPAQAVIAKNTDSLQFESRVGDCITYIEQTLFDGHYPIEPRPGSTASIKNGMRDVGIATKFSAYKYCEEE